MTIAFYVTPKMDSFTKMNPKIAIAKISLIVKFMIALKIALLVSQITSMISKLKNVALYMMNFKKTTVLNMVRIRDVKYADLDTSLKEEIALKFNKLWRIVQNIKKKVSALNVMMDIPYLQIR